MSVEERTIDGPWIQRLSQYLEVSEYSLPATKKCMAAARGFLLYLTKQRVDVAGATAAHEQAFLVHKLNFYRKRHGHGPSDLSSLALGLHERHSHYAALGSRAVAARYGACESTRCISLEPV